MPGMNSGLNSDNPTVVAAFRSALLHQGIIVLVIFGVLAVAWLAIREWSPGPRRGPARNRGPATPAARPCR